MKKQGYNPFRQGTFGDLTQYMRMGEIVLREAHNKSGFGVRTPDQMRHRLKWSNLIALWRVMCEQLKVLFTVHEENQTQYNVFTRVNMPLASAYLTKEEYRFGGAVLFNMIISMGTLNPRIQMLWKQGLAISDIRLGDLEIGPATTVGEFSRAVMASNNPVGVAPRFRRGDCIKAYRLVQSVFSEYQIPTVSMQVLEVTLDEGDPTKLCEVVGTKDFLSYKGYLTARVPDGTMFTFIQTRRKSSGTVEVTTEILVGKNPLLVDYSSDAAFERALDSYGGYNHVNAADPGDNATKFDAAKFTDSEFVIDEDVDFDFDSGIDFDTPSGGVNPSPAPTQVELTFAVNNSAWGTVTPESGLYTVGSTIQAVATPKSGCEFTGWSDSVTTATRTITVPATAQTYTANFRTGGGLGVWLEQHPDATPEEIAEEMKRLKEAGEL